MATNRVIFQYENHIIVSESVEEVKTWIDSLPGLTCSDHALKNIDCIINKEWVRWGAYNQNISPLNIEGYQLDCLKTTGIRTGTINILLTLCNTVEEVLAERAAFTKRIEDTKVKVTEIASTLGNQLLLKLSKKSKSCVDISHQTGLQFTIRIGQQGYWYNTGFGGCYDYIEEYFTHFNGETLVTDEKKNLIDILNKFINEN